MDDTEACAFFVSAVIIFISHPRGEDAEIALKQEGLNVTYHQLDVEDLESVEWYDLTILWYLSYTDCTDCIRCGLDKLKKGTNVQ